METVNRIKYLIHRLTEQLAVSRLTPKRRKEIAKTILKLNARAKREERRHSGKLRQAHKLFRRHRNASVNEIGRMIGVPSATINRWHNQYQAGKQGACK